MFSRGKIPEENRESAEPANHTDEFDSQFRVFIPIFLYVDKNTILGLIKLDFTDGTRQKECTNCKWEPVYY